MASKSNRIVTTKKAQGKKSSPRVGSTKLSKARFLRPWMALPATAVVALVGFAIVQFSQAGNCGYQESYCWSPYQFNGVTKGSVQTSSNGVTWNPALDKDRSFYVKSSLKRAANYCLTSQGRNTVFVEAILKGKVTHRQYIKSYGCLYVSGVNRGDSNRTIKFTVLSNNTKKWSSDLRVVNVARYYAR